MTTSNFTLAQITEMIKKGVNRNLTQKEANKMLNDIKGMTEIEANKYMVYWSLMQWFNRINNNNPKDCLDIWTSCRNLENKYAYLKFLVDDMARVKL